MSSGRLPRIGIVGLGTIGRIHATRLENLNCTLLGADRDRSAREEFSETFDAPTYSDHRSLLDADIDAIIVGVPNRYHEEIAIDALEADVDVLLEKPMAHSLASAERIASVARETDAFCAIGFTMRFAAQTNRAVSLRDDGAYGPLSHVHVDYIRRDGIPRNGGWFVDEELAGGGVLMDLGVHIVDLALYLLEYPKVVEVSGQVRSEFGDYSVDDSANAFIRCANGQTISVETAWHGTAMPSKTCVLRGTDGGVTFDLDCSELTLVDSEPGVEPETLSVEQSDTYRREAQAFLEMIAGDREPVGTVVEGVTVQRILDAIYESSRQERAVQLDTSS